MIALTACASDVDKCVAAGMRAFREQARAAGENRSGPRFSFSDSPQKIREDSFEFTVYDNWTGKKYKMTANAAERPPDSEIVDFMFKEGKIKTKETQSEAEHELGLRMNCRIN